MRNFVVVLIGTVLAGLITAAILAKTTFDDAPNAVGGSMGQASATSGGSGSESDAPSDPEEAAPEPEAADFEASIEGPDSAPLGYGSFELTPSFDNGRAVRAYWTDAYGARVNAAVGPNPFNCIEVGVFTITLTGFDENGNRAETTHEIACGQ